MRDADGNVTGMNSDYMVTRFMANGANDGASVAITESVWTVSAAAIPDWNNDANSLFEGQTASSDADWTLDTSIVGSSSFTGIKTSGQKWMDDMEDGEYAWCWLYSLKNKNGPLTNAIGCDIITIGEPSCITASTTAGILEGICDVEDAGAGLNASGRPNAVPNPVDSESGASSLLYGTALALITAQLAF